MPKHRASPSFNRARELPVAERIVYLHEGQLAENAASVVFDLKNTALLIENYERNNPFLPPLSKGAKLSKEHLREAENQRKQALEGLRRDMDMARSRLAAAVLDNDANLLRAVADVIEQHGALNEQKKVGSIQGEEFVYLDRNSADPAATHIARWHLERRAAGLSCTCSDFLEYAEKIPGSPYRRMTLARIKSARASLAKTAKSIGCPFDAEAPGPRPA